MYVCMYVLVCGCGCVSVVEIYGLSCRGIFQYSFLASHSLEIISQAFASFGVWDLAEYGTISLQ